MSAWHSSSQQLAEGMDGEHMGSIYVFLAEGMRDWNVPQELLYWTRNNKRNFL